MDSLTDRLTLRRSVTFSLLTSAVAAVTLLFFTSATFADPAGPPAELPAFGIRINDHGEGPPVVINPPGLEIAENRFRFEGEHGSPGVGRWHIEWDVEVNPDPFVFASLIISNNLPIDQEFTINMPLSINPSIQGGTLIGGSFSGVLQERTADTATLSLLGGANPPPLYSALIDGNVVHTLFDNPGSITVAQPFETMPFGPGNFGTPIPSLLGPDEANSTIDIELNFTLSANDSVTFSGVFVVEPVPEPSTITLAALGLLGLLGIRRRRTA